MVLLQLAHSGTYPVTVEGGETIIREILRNIRAAKAEMGTTLGEGSLKKVDEVEFYQSGGTTFGILGTQLNHWRNELAAALGVPNLWAGRGGGGQALSAY